MKLTPKDVESLKDQSKWDNFTYNNEEDGLEGNGGMATDDGTNF